MARMRAIAILTGGPIPAARTLPSRSLHSNLLQYPPRPSKMLHRYDIRIDHKHLQSTRIQSHPHLFSSTGLLITTYHISGGRHPIQLA